MKSGFTTLNRLLEIPTSPPNGAIKPTSPQRSVGSPFSRSMTQLNLDTTSQYNKIVPLAAMDNAPFEQTFRITVTLPHNQLYVTRVGAKTRLEQLLEMACKDKQLDKSKYEFRHPADHSQIFANDMTIGAVGLNEVRLVAKTDPITTNNFSLDDLNRMRAGNRNSYAGPNTNSSNNTITNEFPNKLEARHLATKSLSTVSPYSSTNSLNSFDSSSQSKFNSIQGGQPVAPMRKKRAAPRPPSEYSIPENQTIMRQKNFHVSSPNLTQIEMHRKSNGAVMSNGHATARMNGNGPMPSVGRVEEEEDRQQTSAMKGHLTGSVIELSRTLSRTSSNASETVGSDGNPEPVPRKRMSALAKKKKAAAPAPPPRIARESLTPTPPVPTPRTITPVRDMMAAATQQPSSDIKDSNVSKVMLNVDVPKVDAVEPAIPQQESPPRQPSPPSTPLKEVTSSMENKNSHVEMEIKQNGSPVSISILTTTAVEQKPDAVDMSKSIEPSSSDEDDGQRMNIYNLKSMACVEAEIENGHGMGKEAIQELIMDEMTKDNGGLVTNGGVTERPKVVPEELYAKVMKTNGMDASIKKSEEERNKRNENGGGDKIIEDVKEGVKIVDPETRSDSPLWTYTLPAPPHFADGNNNTIGKVAPTETPTMTDAVNHNSVYYNYSSADDDNMTIRSMTTLVSDVMITPVIKERIPIMEDPILPLDDSNNNSESSDFNSSSTLTSSSLGHGGDLEGSLTRPKKLIINSDIEDGYLGGREPSEMRQNLIESLEKRREKYIENELQMLAAEPNEGIKAPVLPQSPVVEVINPIARPITASPTLNGHNQMVTKEPASTDDDSTISKVREFTKNPALTMNLVKRNPSIQRSDSFHSTQIMDGLNGTSGEDSPRELTTADRSSSYMSLIGTQNFEQRRNSFLLEMENSRNAFNRRRSSSELSISDNPSPLQSLEVMKSILNNARKNSADLIPEAKEENVKDEEVQVMKEEKKVFTEVIEEVLPLSNEKQQTLEREATVEAVAPAKAEEVKKVEVEKKEEEQEVPMVKEEVKKMDEPIAKEEPKKWVYTGPPTINLGSWTERPKVQVCIKSDSDYHHNSLTETTSTAATAQRPSLVLDSMPVTAAEKRSIATAPIIMDKLPIVRGVELKKPVEIPPKPEIAPKTTLAVNPTPRQLQRPFSIHGTKYAPVVRGFSWIKSNDTPTTEITSVKVNPVIPNGNLAAKVNGITAAATGAATANVEVKEEVKEVPKVAVEVKSPPIVKSQPISPPPPAEKPVLFSQTTLRRTGLKDKILAQPEEEVTAVPVVAKEVATVRPKLVIPSQMVAPMPVAKVAVVNGSRSPMASPPPPPPPAPVEPKTAPIVLRNPLANGGGRGNHLRPVVRDMVKKQTQSLDVDPRSQLLDSIRNFNFNNLRKM